ncbi:hypothetical protein Esti_000897 [Eimeria stiedai]
MPLFSEASCKVPSCFVTSECQNPKGALSAHASLTATLPDCFRINTSTAQSPPYESKAISQQDTRYDDMHRDCLDRSFTTLTDHQAGGNNNDENEGQHFVYTKPLQLQITALKKNRSLSRDICYQAEELSDFRKEYRHQTPQISRLAEQYGSIRASAESAAVELAEMKKRLSTAKAEAGLAANDRIDLMRENSQLRQEYTHAVAQLSSVRQELGRLRAVQTDLEEARALLERGRKLHSVDQKRICKLEKEVKAIADIEQQLLIAQREAYAANIQNASLLKELEKAQDASKSLQNLSERAIWLEQEHQRLFEADAECERLRRRIAHEQNQNQVLLDKNAEANVQLQVALEKKTLLKQELEAQARKIICLSADLTSANQREARKTDELRVATEEARRLQVVVDQYAAEINHLRGENAMLTKGLEDSSKQQLQDLANSLTENQKLSMELDSSRSENNRLAADIQHMQEAEQHHLEALQRSSEERKALSRQLENLQRHLGTAQELQKFQKEELEATVAALEQQCKTQETAFRRVQCLNEELEASLELVRQQHRDQEKRDSQLMDGMRTELKEAQMQHEAALLKKKQLRDQLRETTRALHITRVRNEEHSIRAASAQKHRSTTAAARAAREKEWATKCATLQARVDQLQQSRKLDAAQRQEEKTELRQQQQELENCKGLLRSLQLTQRELEQRCYKKDAELAAYRSEAERISVERAFTEAAWARTLEEQVQQRVSVLEKDFAMRIAKIRKKVAERAEYNHLLDELLAAERSIMRRWREGMDMWRKALATSLTSRTTGEAIVAPYTTQAEKSV